MRWLFGFGPTPPGSEIKANPREPSRLWIGVRLTGEEIKSLLKRIFRR